MTGSAYSGQKHLMAVNCGSSSVKVSLFTITADAAADAAADAPAAPCCCRLIDADLKGIHSAGGGSILQICSARGISKVSVDRDIGVEDALKRIFFIIFHEYGIDSSSLLAIGHRFVHGGSRYISSVRIDHAVIEGLEGLRNLAPLHNDACLLGIKACEEFFKGAIPQVAVFDTAFHSTLPDVAANYAVAGEVAAKYQIKRYGFHGISCAFIWEAYKKLCIQPPGCSKLIIMHLGNGCSMTALQDGVSVDTSMGFTPAEGLIMATRAGDIDAGVIEFLCSHQKKSAGEIIQQLNFNSGLLGVSGLTSNMEELLRVCDSNEKARLAVEMFCYRIVKYLGAYIAVLGGVDAIIFSGGIGENAAEIRSKVVEKMAWHGIKLDSAANGAAVGLPAGGVRMISAPDSSSASVYVVAADENFFLAQEALRLA